MKKAGFTMIELVFVIVILGILAAVAIPKLAATRDDAKVSREMTNLSTCISDAGAAYTARGTLDLTSIACTSLKCFTTADDGNGTLNVGTGGDDNGQTYCTDAQTKAADRNLTGVHKFGGTGVVY